MQVGSPPRDFLGLTDIRALEDQAPRLTLWEADPYRLWSLWDMMIFHSAAFAAAWGEFNRACVILGSAEAAHLLEEVSKAVTGLHEEVVRAKLPLSHGTLDHFRLIKMNLDRSSPDIPMLFAEARSIHNGLLGDLSQQVFFRLQGRNAGYYVRPQRDWENVIARFPAAVLDIEEASKTLALERFTASVFHLMRVVEVGLRALGHSLNDPSLDPKRNPTWEAILKKCDTELQKPRQQQSPEWAADSTFFANAAANLRAVKEAWRNPTLHVEISYDEERAVEVYSAVRAFMRHLATKLHG